MMMMFDHKQEKDAKEN